MGPVEMRMHEDGHGAWETQAPVRIWASSRSRVWIPRSSIDRHRFEKEIHHLEHSRLVHIHWWLNRSPQQILNASNLGPKLNRKSGGNNKKMLITSKYGRRNTRASPN